MVYGWGFMCLGVYGEIQHHTNRYSFFDILCYDGQTNVFVDAAFPLFICLFALLKFKETELNFWFTCAYAPNS